MKFITLLSLALCLVTLSVKSILGIYNGKSATIGQFTYQAGLFFTHPTEIKVCSGALIGAEWVVTVANCANNALSCSVSLGSIHLFKPEVMRYVVSHNIFVHPQYKYSETNLQHNIALLKIATVKFSENINPIAIPSISRNYYGEEALMTGWGATNDYYNTVILQWAAAEIAETSDCDRIYPKYNMEIMMCTSTYRDTSPCKGDSGAPLVLYKDRILVGLYSISFTFVCRAKYPVTFTSLSGHLSWIKNMTGIYYDEKVLRDDN